MLCRFGTQFAYNPTDPTDCSPRFGTSRKCAPFSLFSFLFVPGNLFAQSPLRMEERLIPGATYHVSCRVQITGKMTLPGKTLDIDGKSHIEYDERVLRVNDAGAVDKTLRLFSSLAFERKIGDDVQKNSLRPAVHRLVIVRQGNIEAPFSPDGLLKLGEIDLIRTDVFTPALSGMLPKDAVAPGDSWKGTEAATRELTDLVQITGGELTCRFVKADAVQAKIAFEGIISGVGENGPTKHELDGFCYFDLKANALSYVSLKGTEHLLDEKGEAKGRVTGTFVLTREMKTAPAGIADTTNLTLDPDEDNTRLLFEDEELGLRFAHSRKWKPRVDGSQVRLDDLRGNGVVITLDPVARVPTLQQFQNEVRTGIERRKGTVTFVSPMNAVQRQPTAVESLSIEADIPGEKGSQRGILLVAVIRDEAFGATLAATLVTNDRATLAREMERLAASVRASKGK